MNKSIGFGSFLTGVGLTLIFTLNLNNNSIETVVKFLIAGFFVLLPYFLIVSFYDTTQIRDIDDLSEGKKFRVICKFENKLKDNSDNYIPSFFINSEGEVKDYDFFLISMFVKDYNSVGTKEEFFFVYLKRSVSFNLEDNKIYFKKEGKFFLLE
jgi:hypothetical protein